jgi:hypothetical protein
MIRFVPILLVLSGISNYSLANEDIEILRRELQQLRSDYDARIQQLEDRLARAEKTAAIAQQEADEAILMAEELATQPAGTPINSATAFNPAIGVVLNGSISSHNREDFIIPGFMPGPETGPGESGLNIGETEINLKASVDDKFLGNLTFALAAEDGEVEIELEEAFIQTLSLPTGFTMTAGRFFSGIGYLNNFHSHADDFSDRPLPYQSFLANQLKDDGVQLRWLAPSSQFLEFGVEVFRGSAFPASGAAREGKGTYAAFVHLGDDVGVSHSWQAGISTLKAKVENRADDSGNLFSGDSDLSMVDLVWKWAPQGNRTVTNFKIMGEYFWREEEGSYGALPYRGDQSGWYLQGVYQFTPGWSVGYRYDVLDADNRGVSGTLLDDMDARPERNTLMLQWANSEFGRFRLQYTKDESGLDSDDQIRLEYTHAFGAHGGHQF